MSDHVLKREQFVPRPLDEVFALFSRPENLARLTPPELGFRILTPEPIAMRAGALIDYVVHPFGLPLRWTTLIDSYDPPHSFVDIQLRGPYDFWHHTHRFTAVEGGTLIVDEVRYRLPLAPAGDIAHPLVARQLADIFEHRRRTVEALFAPRGEGMKIIIAGGSGFIGRRLVARLKAEGRDVVVLTRSPGRLPSGVRGAAWDGRTVGDWAKELEGAQAVINLCGEGVADAPWTSSRRRVLESSRLAPTRALAQAMTAAERKPQAFISASAVGIYGDAGERVLTEGTTPPGGFLSDLCVHWEEEARRPEAAGIRCAQIRLGVVLGGDGGALKRMLLPFRLGLGGRLGSGAQWFPWISADDAVGLFAAAAVEPSYKGAINAAAPGAATNAQFTKALGGALGRPTIFPVPGFLLRTALGEMSSILLNSQRVEPAAALASGYKFLRPNLDEALALAVKEA